MSLFTGLPPPPHIRGFKLLCFYFVACSFSGTHVFYGIRVGVLVALTGVLVWESIGAYILLSVKFIMVCCSCFLCAHGMRGLVSNHKGAVQRWHAIEGPSHSYSFIEDDTIYKPCQNQGAPKKLSRTHLDPHLGLTLALFTV